MSEAFEGFAALLKLSDNMLARAERQDLQECVRLLAVYCAEFRSKFWSAAVHERPGLTLTGNDR